MNNKVNRRINLKMMANPQECVKNKLEDMRPIFDMMKTSGKFTESEVQEIIKKFEKHEYEHKKQPQDNNRYYLIIKYCLDLYKLVKQPKEKYNDTQKKSNLEIAIADKINCLYQDAIFEDYRYWVSFMKFCKHAQFYDWIDPTTARMLEVHQDKPKCWHIAALWELEQNKDFQSAKRFLLRGLHFHPTSQLLASEIFKLELNETVDKIENFEAKSRESNISSNRDNIKASINLKKCFNLYEQTLKKIKDIKFIIELLDISVNYKHTEKLQQRILDDMLQEFTHEPLMWDTLARRELKGLITPSAEKDENLMEIDSSNQNSLRDRLNNCFEVYQTGISTISTEAMWSLFIDCMLEINQETDTLPNFKRKLLKNALVQGCQAKKLEEKYYLYWIGMITIDQPNQDPTKSKLYEILCCATETLPQSESLWHARLNYLQNNDLDDLAEEVFNKAINFLGENSLQIWQLRLLYLTAKDINIENFFENASKNASVISNFMKPHYVEWVFFEKDICEARKIYDKLCVGAAPCLELHKKMITIELAQAQISLKNVRKAYEMSLKCFGKKNIDVWLSFINFEINYGEPKNIINIREKAIKTLNPDLHDEFMVQYHVKKSLLND